MNLLLLPEGPLGGTDTFLDFPFQGLAGIPSLE